MHKKLYIQNVEYVFTYEAVEHICCVDTTPKKKRIAVFKDNVSPSKLEDNDTRCISKEPH